jgi:hypothetical protein
MNTTITITAYGTPPAVLPSTRDGYHWVTVADDGVCINVHVRNGANVEEIAQHLRTALALAKEPA